MRPHRGARESASTERAQRPSPTRGRSKTQPRLDRPRATGRRCKTQTTRRHGRTGAPRSPKRPLLPDPVAARAGPEYRRRATTATAITAADRRRSGSTTAAPQLANGTTRIGLLSRATVTHQLASGLVKGLLVEEGAWGFVWKKEHFFPSPPWLRQLDIIAANPPRQLDIIATDATAAQSRSGPPLHALQAKPEAERHSCTRQHGEVSILPPQPDTAQSFQRQHFSQPFLEKQLQAAASKALARPGTDRRDTHPKAAAASTASEPSNASLWPAATEPQQQRSKREPPAAKRPPTRPPLLERDDTTSDRLLTAYSKLRAHTAPTDTRHDAIATAPTTRDAASQHEPARRRRATPRVSTSRRQHRASPRARGAPTRNGAARSSTST